MSTYRPLNDRVLVKVADPETKTASGLYIPDSVVKDKPQQGVVHAVGPGIHLESGTFVPTSVKRGQEVLFGAYAGIDIKIGDQNFLVIRETDVLLAEEGENDG